MIAVKVWTTFQLASIPVSRYTDLQREGAEADIGGSGLGQTTIQERWRQRGAPLVSRGGAPHKNDREGEYLS